MHWKSWFDLTNQSFNYWKTILPWGLIWHPVFWKIACWHCYVVQHMSKLLESKRIFILPSKLILTLQINALNCHLNNWCIKMHWFIFTPLHFRAEGIEQRIESGGTMRLHGCIESVTNLKSCSKHHAPFAFLTSKIGVLTGQYSHFHTWTPDTVQRIRSGHYLELLFHMWHTTGDCLWHMCSHLLEILWLV